MMKKCGIRLPKIVSCYMCVVYHTNKCDATGICIEHIGRLVRMSVLDTEVDGSNPGSSMLFP